MSDYFGRLAARTLDPACLLQPRITPRFAWQDEEGEMESATPHRTPAIYTPPSVSQRTMAPANQASPEATSTSVASVQTTSGKPRELATAPLSQTPPTAPEPGMRSSARETRIEEMVPSTRPNLAAERSAAPDERVRTIEASTPAQRPPDEIAAHAEQSLPRPIDTSPAPQTNVIVTPARIERIVEHERVERAKDSAPDQPAPREPDVHITIGRIDVRAATTAAPVRTVAPRRESRPTTLTLEEYLAQRSEGRR